MYPLSRERRAKVYAELWPAHPRGGIWAWWAQRLTGVLLLGYVVWHVVTIGHAAHHPERMAGVLRALFYPMMVAALIVGLVYHSANGIRIVLFDLGVDAMRRHWVHWTVLLVAAIVVVAWLTRTGLHAP